MNQRVSSVQITRVAKASKSSEPDLVAVEEPLEIRVGYGPEDKRQQATITVTMRTPGNDEQLCLGFLFTEGIISDISDIHRRTVSVCFNGY